MGLSPRVTLLAADNSGLGVTVFSDTQPGSWYHRVLGPACKRGTQGLLVLVWDHVTSRPRAAKLRGLLNPWAVLRRTCMRLLVPSMRPVEGRLVALRVLGRSGGCGVLAVGWAGSSRIGVVNQIRDRRIGVVCDPIGMCELLVGVGEVDVLSVDDDRGGPLRLSVRSRTARPPCAGCGGKMWSKGDRAVELVDLPSFGRPVRLVWHNTVGAAPVVIAARVR